MEPVWLVIVGLLSILVYLAVSKHSARLSVMYLLLAGLIGVGVIKDHFDNRIFTINDIQLNQLNEERGYFPNLIIGKFIENKYQLFFYNWEKNVFNLLDINSYFFAGHPRETEDNNQNKYFWLLLPLFVIGLNKRFRSINKYYIWIVIYSVAVSSFINPRDQLYLVLMLPVINILMIDGVVVVFRRLSNVKS